MQGLATIDWERSCLARQHETQLRRIRGDLNRLIQSEWREAIIKCRTPTFPSISDPATDEAEAREATPGIGAQGIPELAGAAFTFSCR